MLTVTARNVGRSPAQVVGWGLKLPTGQDLVLPFELPMNPRTPLTIEGGHAQTWYVPFPLLTDIVPENREWFPFSAWVRLATGVISESNVREVSGSLVHSDARENGHLLSR